MDTEYRRKSNVTLDGSMITEIGMDIKKEYQNQLKENALTTTGKPIFAKNQNTEKIFENNTTC